MKATRQPYVMRVLDDGRLELSNSIAERAIRPFVIGRSNWMFCDSQDGARASAALYSIVATARANGLNPRLQALHRVAADRAPQCGRAHGRGAGRLPAVGRVGARGLQDGEGRGKRVDNSGSFPPPGRTVSDLPTDVPYY